MSLTKRRVAALVAAALALPLAGAIAVSGGTVAALQDSVDAHATVGVEGIYAIARTVTIGVKNTTTGGATQERVDTQLVDSRQAPAKATGTGPGTGRQGNIDFNLANQIHGCVSTTFGGNTDRCANAPGAPLAQAATGYTANGWNSRYRDMASDELQIAIADAKTAVECRADGTAIAHAPQASNVWFGWASGTTAVGNTNIPLPAANTYYHGMQWASTTWQRAQSYRVETIQKTFSNPTRAVSAIIIYTSASDGAGPSNYTADSTYTIKSECAVQGVETGGRSATDVFGTTTVTPKRIPGRSYGECGYKCEIGSGPITDFSAVTGSSASNARTQIASQPDASRRRADASETEPSRSPNEVDARRSMPEGVAPEQVTPSGESTTTTPEGPDPSTTPSSPQPVPTRFVRADGEELSATDTALVEEAIEAAETADSGEINGVQYDVVENQLDGTTLIITRTDGSTLRIVWEV